MDNGLETLRSHGFRLLAPLRNDDKPRAVWPSGIKPLPLTLEGEEGHGPYDWTDEFRDMAKAILAKRAAATTAKVLPPPPVLTLDQLRADLAEARAGFDPAYAFSDDHTYYCEQLRKASRIVELSKQIAAREGADCQQVQPQELA